MAFSNSGLLLLLGRSVKWRWKESTLAEGRMKPLNVLQPSHSILHGNEYRTSGQELGRWCRRFARKFVVEPKPCCEDWKQCTNSLVQERFATNFWGVRNPRLAVHRCSHTYIITIIDKEAMANRCIQSCSWAKREPATRSRAML
jgi:hypothetical protein